LFCAPKRQNSRSLGVTATNIDQLLILENLTPTSLGIFSDHMASELFPQILAGGAARAARGYQPVPPVANPHRFVTPLRAPRCRNPGPGDSDCAQAADRELLPIRSPYRNHQELRAAVLARPPT
jgi:hypothetical protein